MPEDSDNAGDVMTSTADQKEAVEEFLSGLLTAFGLREATVTCKEEEDNVLAVDVQGGELGLLVGPKGHTLQALLELTRSMVQRKFVGQDHLRIHLDVAGYRKRRQEALERFAKQVAEDVAESGRSKALDPMPASDRKVIHDVVNTMEGVVTGSEGDEPYRRVVINPR